MSKEESKKISNILSYMNTCMYNFVLKECESIVINMNDINGAPIDKLNKCFPGLTILYGKYWEK